MPRKEFIKAELKVFYVDPGKRVTIGDSDTIARLLRFFPEIGQGKESPDAVGSESEVEVVKGHLKPATEGRIDQATNKQL